MRRPEAVHPAIESNGWKSWKGLHRLSVQGFHQRKRGSVANDGGDGEEKAIEVLWRKSKRKTQLAQWKKLETGLVSAKTTRAAAKVLKARDGLSQDLGREGGARESISC